MSGSALENGRFLKIFDFRGLLAYYFLRFQAAVILVLTKMLLKFNLSSKIDNDS
jgi:hypothetical protein